MLSFGVFGITNDGLNQAVSVLFLVLIVIWAALVFWTYADARRRIDDPMLIGCATAAVISSSRRRTSSRNSGGRTMT